MRLAHARRMLRALLASAALLLPAALAGCASLPPTRAHGMFVERQLDDHGQLRRYQVFVVEGSWVSSACSAIRPRYWWRLLTTYRWSVCSGSSPRRRR